MALYYRCPRCQALMDIDPRKKLQECKYCGTTCTEDEAKAKIEELGSDEAWDLYYSNEFGGVFEDPQPTAGLVQTRVDKSAQLEAELRKEVEEALVEEKKEDDEKEDSLTRGLRAILVLIVLAIYVFLYFISHFSM